ncbi:cupin-like domain-containing protein [Aureococcus anophagefferens]|nr:cupin-like domain-containing protein [Aureococcus anophagefferens]
MAAFGSPSGYVPDTPIFKVRRRVSFRGHDARKKRQTPAFANALTAIVTTHEARVERCGLANATVDRVDAGTELFEVAHEPLVWVRDRPSTDSDKINFKWRGERVRVVPGVRERGWLKLADGSGWLEDGRAASAGSAARDGAARGGERQRRAEAHGLRALRLAAVPRADARRVRRQRARDRGACAARRSLASAGLGGPFLERPEAWTGTVDVLERADQWRFEDYVEKNAPVLLRGALADWAPVKKWTDAYVRKANLYDDHKVALADYLDDDPDRPYYAARVDVGRELPELLKDLDAAGPPGGLQSAFGPPMPSNPILCFGRGSDPRGELDGLMLGRGVVTLHHPGDGDCLYPSGDRNAKSVFSLVDPRLDGAEIAARFPKTAGARPLEVTVRKGDMLYIPLGWWHFIRALPGRNMSINHWYPQRRATSSDGLREFARAVAKRPPRKSL